MTYHVSRSLDNRFGGGEGAPHFLKPYLLHHFCTVFKLFESVPFLKPFGKKPRTCSTGLETGCKPVLLKMAPDGSLKWASKGLLMNYVTRFWSITEKNVLSQVKFKVKPLYVREYSIDTVY